jgi:glycosyltransferase involved in cell wall biosynthesis
MNELAKKGAYPRCASGANRPRLLLISNYAPDRQESMLRFADLLQQGFRERGYEVVTVRPAVLAGRFFSSTHAFSKWVGYLDKLILFPPRLRRMSRTFDVAHICDHSNAPYQRWLKAKAVVATCHDLLAVRGARGEDTYCPASGLGKRLQDAILRNLSAISHVACDSDATLADFSRLTGRSTGQFLRTIRLGFDSVFRRPPDSEIHTALTSLGLAAVPYVLHVGSSQARKNRENILRSIAYLGDRWVGRIVFVGERLRPEQARLAADLGLNDRVIDLGPMSDATLAALYAGAHAFMFPSFCEGFGWPVLEAQACGCAVITANNTSLKEVAGDGAMVFDAADVAGMGEAVLQLTNPLVKKRWLKKGTENIQRFGMSEMLNSYEALYMEALANVV